MRQFYTLDGKSLYDLDPNSFTYLNISEVILVKGKKMDFVTTIYQQF
jgi:hypothetical protein